MQLKTKSDSNRLKKILLFLSLFFFGLTSFSQDENYDEIFDDGDKESMFRVGTDFATLASGTVNFYGIFTPTESFAITAGIGVSPFGFLFDATTLADDGLPLHQDGLNMGMYYTAGLRYYPTSGFGSNSDSFSGYYALGIDRWSNSSTYGVKRYKRTKINFNYGWGIGLIGRLNLDIETGISAGLFSEFETSSNPTGSSFFYGINLAFGLNYAL